MSLIECKECKKQISDKAKTCPHCGAKVKKSHPVRLVLMILLGACIGFVIIAALVQYKGGGLYHYNKGVKYQQTGQTELAEQQFKLALQNNPELAEAHLNLGLIYIDRDWYEGAETSTKKAVEIFERTQRTFVEGSNW